MIRWLSLDPAGCLWGSERALLDFIAEVPGAESACCCPPGTPLIPRLERISVPVFPFFRAGLHETGKRERLLALGGLARALRAFRPHVLHVNQAGATRIALAAARVFRIPCVVHLRLREDVDYLDRLRPSPRHLTNLLTISDAIEERVAARSHLRQIRRTRMLDAYRPQSPGDKAADPAEAEWDVICVGRFAPSKGQSLLLEALSILARRGVHPRTAFVGELNEEGTALREEAARRGLASSVEFLGHCDRVLDRIAGARWLVCPSSFEPLGRVLFEAWDAGRPVIVGSSSGGAASSVQSSGGGLLFPSWIAEDLAGTIEKALSLDGAAERALAHRGRAWMRQATDPEPYAAKFGQILREAVGARSRIRP